MMVIPRKIQTGGQEWGWRHGISRGIEEISQTTLPFRLDFFWNSPIIIRYVIVIVQVLTDRWKSKFKTRNEQVFTIWLMLKNTRDHFFLKKRFPNLDFVKAVSIIMIAISEKMKMKRSHPLGPMHFFSPTSFSFPDRFFIKLLTLRNFLKHSSPPLQKNGQVENYVYSSENRCNNIWIFVCSFWSLLMFFECFYCCWLYSIWFLVKTFQTKTSIFMTK